MKMIVVKLCNSMSVVSCYEINIQGRNKKKEFVKLFAELIYFRNFFFERQEKESASPHSLGQKRKRRETSKSPGEDKKKEFKCLNL